MPTPPNAPFDFNSLMKVVESLLGPDGCPWDKEQTHQSLMKYCIEEAYELKEAVDNEDFPHIKEELGDLLFQVALHAQMAKNAGHFTDSDVIYSITEKMIRRHPHVFAETEVSNVDDVMKNWEEIKHKEKPNRTKSAFDYQKGLPALFAAEKIGNKSKKYDFDFNSTKEALTKIEEELNELKQALKNNDTKNIEEEIGDLLFTTTCLARQQNVDSETALFKTLDKFKNRMDKMFTLCKTENKDFKTLPRTEKESLWLKAKS